MLLGLAQIVTNLVMNSLQHGFREGRSGTARIDAALVAGEVRLDYRDDGTGMDGRCASACLSPFFTTRRGQGGSGLGLPIVYNLVTQGPERPHQMHPAPARYTLSGLACGRLRAARGLSPGHCSLAAEPSSQRCGNGSTRCGSNLRARSYQVRAIVLSQACCSSAGCPVRRRHRDHGDAAAGRDVGSSQAARVAAAVPVLVVRVGDFGRQAQQGRFGAAEQRAPNSAWCA